MVKHPSILQALYKEVHYFDLNFTRDTGWYRAHFPLTVSKQYAEAAGRRTVITGEASPYYLFHPAVPERARQVVPDCRLIVLLRNPVDRAYSHYHHESRIGYEDRPFREAVEREMELLDCSNRGPLGSGSRDLFSHRHHSYLARGVYVDQLKRWRASFSRAQMLIVRSEDMFEDPMRVINRVFKFLGVHPWKPRRRLMCRTTSYPEMDPTLRKRLERYFEPYNLDLHDEFPDLHFDWQQRGDVKEADSGRDYPCQSQAELDSHIDHRQRDVRAE
jgi:hypothetical protein